MREGLIETKLSLLSSGQKFFFDKWAKYCAYYDHSGSDYFAFVWANDYEKFNSGNVLIKDIVKGKSDCKVFIFKH